MVSVGPCGESMAKSSRKRCCSCRWSSRSRSVRSQGMRGSEAVTWSSKGTSPGINRGSAKRKIVQTCESMSPAAAPSGLDRGGGLLRGDCLDLAIASDRGLGDFLHFEFHEPADFELHGALRGHGDAFHGLGILRHAGGALLALEDAEVAKFKAVTAPKLNNKLVQKLLRDALD